MAALDFGMALARGMLPTSEKAQKDLLNLAGGRNIFKSEDWWNQQVDKQISKGYRTEKFQTQYFVQPTSIIGGYPTGPGQWQAASPSPYGTPMIPTGAVREGFSFPYGAQYKTRSINLGFTGERKDYTAGELKDIEKSAKSGAKKLKSQTEASKSAQKKLRRGTGGLMGKARLPGELPSTGLPELGSLGLGLEQGTLGGKVKL